MKPRRKQTPLLIAVEIIGVIVTFIGLCQLPGEIANLINPPTTVYERMMATSTVQRATMDAIMLRYAPTRTVLAATPAVDRASLGCAQTFGESTSSPQCDSWAAAVATSQPTQFSWCAERLLTDPDLYLCVFAISSVPAPFTP